MAETLGRYELIAEIGRGGMADVTLAMQRGPDGFEKLVVLKVVHEDLASDAEVVGMLKQEAKLSAQIKHPNVVDVYELGEENGRHFIAMEYLEGEPLLSVLDKSSTESSEKRIDPLSVARIIADTAEGLDAAHELKGRDGKPLNVVHHDVSLGNIFILYSGQVKLLDFGVAKVARKSAQKKNEGAKTFGKLAYMAPEKLDERPGDRRSDIWSLGCVMWEALTFKRLFKGANDIEIVREVRYVNVPPPSTVNKDVPPELDPIVLKALQRDPFRRYQNAKEMAVALEEVLSAKGFPSKNFKIASYMMKTFADTIAARERLLREVAGPHRPSAEVIESAFGDADARKESSLPSFELLVNAPDQVVLPEGSTGSEVALPTPGMPAVEPNPFDSEEDVAETVFDVVPANAEASRSLRSEPDPSWNRSKHGEGLKELQRKAQEQRENPAGYRRKQMIPWAIGVVGGLIVILIFVKVCGGGEKKKVDTSGPLTVPVEPTAVVDAPVAMTPDAAIVVDAQIAAAIDAGDEEIEMPVEEVDRPKPTKSAEQYYADGLAAWKKKDSKAAYDAFTNGRRANSKYANNWYGLGLVHEKAGRKSDARTAYERYLKLAPNAPNGAKLRDHIKKNLL